MNHIEKLLTRITKHGMSKTNQKEYKAWKGMRNRCDSPGASYYNRYGGRGISYCKEWNEFEQFFKEMGKCPDGYELDRINNDGIYCKENCKWSSCAEQARNRSSTKLNKEKVEEIRNIKNVNDSLIAEKFGVSRSLIGQIRRREIWT